MQREERAGSFRDNLLVNQNDAWRYKVTRQRTGLTINFNTRQHQIFLRFSLFLQRVACASPLAHTAHSSTSATVRLMPRSLTTIILGDLGCSISPLASYYPPLNPGVDRPSRVSVSRVSVCACVWSRCTLH